MKFRHRDRVTCIVFTENGNHGIRVKGIIDRLSDCGCCYLVKVKREQKAC